MNISELLKDAPETCLAHLLVKESGEESGRWQRCTQRLSHDGFHREPGGFGWSDDGRIDS